jgi:hypothetical protein
VVGLRNSGGEPWTTGRFDGGTQSLNERLTSHPCGQGLAISGG